MSATVAAPAAPAPAPANGAAKPNGAPAAGAAGQPPAVGVGGEAPVSPKAEPFRFKKALKVGGREMPVDLDEAGLTRELQVRYHLQQEHQAAQAKLKAQSEFEQLLATNPREALKRKGHDLDALLLSEAQRQSQLAELTPEQQRIAELEHRLEQQDKAQKQAAENAKKQAEAAKAQRTRQRIRGTLFESLKHVGFPVDGQENAQFRGQALSMAARIQRDALKTTGVELDAQQLGAAIQRHYLDGVTRTAQLAVKVPEFRKASGPVLNGLLQTLTEGLEGQPLLEAMGPKLVRALIQAQHQQLGARNGVVVGGTAAAPIAQPRGPDGKELAPTLDYYAMKKKWG